MMNNLKKDTFLIKNPKKEQGMVLIVALIMLLLVTILGVSAVNRSGISTQVSGNSMYSMLVYQGAESTLARSVSNEDLSNLAAAILARPAEYSVPVLYLPDETVTGGGTVTSTATISYQGRYDCPISSGVATSTLFDCQIYDIDARSKLKSTGAKGHHVEGKAILSPSP